MQASESTSIKPNTLVESPIAAHAGQGVQVSLMVRVKQRWLGVRGGGVKKIREAVKLTVMQTTSFLKRAPEELQGQPAFQTALEPAPAHPAKGLFPLGRRVGKSYPDALRWEGPLPSRN